MLFSLKRSIDTFHVHQPLGTPESHLSGAIQPFLTTGNDFYNKTSNFKKASISSFFNDYTFLQQIGYQPRMADMITNYRVLGVGDSNGPGWNGADGDATFTLPNGDVIMTFGDGFFTTTISKCFLQTLRNPDKLDMISNSLLYMRKSPDAKSIQNAIYFIGQQSPDISCQDVPSNVYWDTPSKQDPFDFTPIGCGDMFSVKPETSYNYTISPSTIEKSFQNARYWLVGGASGRDHSVYMLALMVAKNIAPEPKVVEFHLLKVSGAFDADNLLINPFLWNDSCEVRYFPDNLSRYVKGNNMGVYSTVRYSRMFELPDAYSGLLGSVNKKIFIIRFRIDDFFNHMEYEGLVGSVWKSKPSLDDLDAITDDVLDLSATTGIYYNGRQYCFLTCIGRTIYRYVSDNLNRFKQSLPVYNLPDMYSDVSMYHIYALHVHPSLLSIVRERYQRSDIEMVFSYITQGNFPVNSNVLFGDMSAYHIYFPQIVYF
jgi:hypothetical protein